MKSLRRWLNTLIARNQLSQTLEDAAASLNLAHRISVTLSGCPGLMYIQWSEQTVASARRELVTTTRKEKSL